MSVTTQRLKSSSTADGGHSKHDQRDSHHDWQSRKNKSIISKKDIMDENETCADNFCLFFNKLPMLNPFAKFRCTWDVFVMFMLIYTSLEVPFTLGFHITLGLTGTYYQFGIIALVIDICLCIDIIFNFRTAYFDKYDDLRLITNAKRIAKRYLKGWFWIDFLTSFPFEFLVLPEESMRDGDSDASVTTYLKMLRIFRLFRIFKILRLLKMVKLFDGFLSNIVAREMIFAMRLFKVLCFALLSAHMCACLWYAVGCDSHSVYNTSWIAEQGMIASRCGITGAAGDTDDTLGVRYSYSWYWSVVTLFTTGYGDVIATNVYEQWTASAVILGGTCLFGYFVGTITSLITEGDKVKSSIMNKLEDAQHFCQQKRLPSNMARAVLTHTRYHCNHNYVLGDEQDVLSNLPSYLAMDVSLYVSRKYLENLDFFGNDFLDPYIRGLIALKMKSISCNKGYKLFVKGDVSEKIYIQRIGKSNHFIYDGKNPKKKPVKKRVSRGDVVGEYAPVLKKRESTLVCETWCEFYVLDVADIKEVMEQHYHNIWSKKWQNICKFLKKEYLKPIRKRKRRKALLQHNPFLPSFRGNGDLETDAASDGKYDIVPKDDGDEGHVNWENDMNQKERKQLHELRQLERMTTAILSANANELNNNNINFGLNALSRNAYKISQLSNKENTNFVKSKIIDPLAQTTVVSSQSLFRGLTRNNSFLRDEEVTRDYHRDASSDSSSGDEVTIDKRFIEEEHDVKQRQVPSDDDGGGGGTGNELDKTMEVATFIEKQVQMMEIHKELNKEQKMEDGDRNYNHKMSGEDDGVDQMISNVYSDIGDGTVGGDEDDELEEEEDEFEDEYESEDGDYSQSDDEVQSDNDVASSGNKNKNRKKKGGHRKKKKRKTQKAHS